MDTNQWTGDEAMWRVSNATWWAEELGKESWEVDLDVWQRSEPEGTISLLWFCHCAIRDLDVIPNFVTYSNCRSYII